MSHAPHSGRIPLRLPSASATFAIAIAGYLGVNLSPYMITALEVSIGVDFITAGWIVTGVLLATAVVGLSVAPLCAGRSRLAVARAGLLLGLVAFGAAALVPTPAVVIAGLLLGGAGAGGAVAASGAAFAAFTNPDRVAGLNGLANRGVITVVLAVLPVLGLAPLNVFGALALFSLIGLVLSAWLPQVPVENPQAASAIAEAVPLPGSSTSAKPGDRRVTVAGFTLLAVFALWAVTEDSLWAMGGVLGESQAGVTPEGLGLALSGATAGGLIGSVLLMVIGDRLGRAVPLAVLLVLGSALKTATGFATDPTAFIVLFIAWNTIYAIAFMYFVAVSAALSADGRWSGPLLAVYLVGSSLTPVIGAGLLAGLGNQGFTIALGLAGLVLTVPAVAVALLSTRLNSVPEAAHPEPEQASGTGSGPVPEPAVLPAGHTTP
ncbi:MFS transporter [Paeniglutamicibacter sp. R2-26]|uniref:MFS transporter n=1 Tax=Paeniglutamicibacter sp. R2-26 TaxID=3144417 RepID=UPI003EE7983F